MGKGRCFKLMQRCHCQSSPELVMVVKSKRDTATQWARFLSWLSTRHKAPYIHSFLFLPMSDHPQPSFAAAVEAIKALLPERLQTPRVGIVCGSGLGGIVECIRDLVLVPYSKIPGFVESTGAQFACSFGRSLWLSPVPGHKSSLAFGVMGPGEGVPVVAMLGRVRPIGFPGTSLQLLYAVPPIRGAPHAHRRVSHPRHGRARNHRRYQYVFPSITAAPVEHAQLPTPLAGSILN